MHFLRHRRQEIELYRSLKKILGFRPRHLELYQLALRHKSQSLQREDGVLLNNERLEFLGDAVLDSLVADILFRHFDLEGEGFLTDTRSKIVKRESLNNLALSLGLDRLLLTSARTDAPRQSIFGNMFEALIAAVYLDRGYMACKRFVEKRIVGHLVDLEDVAHQEENFKSMLLEWSQHNKKKLDFMTVECDGKPSRNPVFECRIYVDDVFVSSNTGYSKKNAQQNAARLAWEKLRENPVPVAD